MRRFLNWSKKNKKWFLIVGPVALVGVSYEAHKRRADFVSGMALLAIPAYFILLFSTYGILALLASPVDRLIGSVKAEVQDAQEGATKEVVWRMKRRILIVAIALSLLAVIFPPFEFKSPSLQRYEAHAFFLSQPKTNAQTCSHCRISVQYLGMEIAAIWLLAGLAYVVTKKKEAMDE